jgi:hypothetical protein
MSQPASQSITILAVCGAVALRGMRFWARLANLGNRYGATKGRQARFRVVGGSGGDNRRIRLGRRERHRDLVEHSIARPPTETRVLAANIIRN